MYMCLCTVWVCERECWAGSTNKRRLTLSDMLKKEKKMLDRMFTLPTRQNHLVYTDKLRQVRERKMEEERERACKLKLNVFQLFEINSANCPLIMLTSD